LRPSSVQPQQCHAQSYKITTIAGGGTNRGTDGFGDGGGAMMATLAGNGGGLVVASSGNLYISDWGNNLVRRVTPGGTISVFARDPKGYGGGYYGDNGPAVGAGLNNPLSLALDSSGNLYITDFVNQRIRKVSTNGTITTVAGVGSGTTLGGQATQTFLSPTERPGHGFERQHLLEPEPRRRRKRPSA